MWPRRNQVGQRRPCQLQKAEPDIATVCEPTSQVRRDRASDVPGWPIRDKPPHPPLVSDIPGQTGFEGGRNDV